VNIFFDFYHLNVKEQGGSFVQKGFNDPTIPRLSAFWTREDPQPTSQFDVACPCPDELIQDETQGGG
jgi:hypothetical protein